MCCFDACVSWLHGLIDTYAEPNPDKPEVHHLIIAYTIELPEKIEFTWHDTDASPPSDIAFHWINKRDIASQHFYPNHEALLLKACEM